MRARGSAGEWRDYGGWVSLFFRHRFHGFRQIRCCVFHNLYILTAMATLHRHNIQLMMNTHHPTADNEAGILTPMHPRSNTKVPASPPHHKGRRSRPGRAPCISEPKGAAEITSVVVTLFLIPDSPDPVNVNQQGWLPPCRP